MKNFAEEDKKHKQSIDEGFKDLETKTAVDDDVLDSLNDIFSKTQQTKPKTQRKQIKAKRGRPKGSINKLDRAKVADQKITISLSLEEKELLQREAEKADRTVSSFIKYQLKKAGVFGKRIQRNTI